MITHSVKFHGEEFTIRASHWRYRWFVGCVQDGKPMKVGWHADKKIAEADMAKTRRTWIEATGWAVLPVQITEAGR